MGVPRLAKTARRLTQTSTDFRFTTKDEAKEALRAGQTAGWKERYGLIVKKDSRTTIDAVATRYKNLASAKRLSQRTEDTTYWRDRHGHILTLERFVRWAEKVRPLSSVL